MRGLLYGGVGFALGIGAMLLLEDRPMVRSERRDQDAIAELRADIEERDVRIREKEQQLREQEMELTKLRAEAGPAAPAETTRKAPVEIGAAIHDAAAALRVPDDALRAAFDAYTHGSKENLDRLAQHGADGFRALVALLRGGLSGTTFNALFERAWSPAAAGQERMLFETADAEAVHVWSRWTALSALGVADTPATREYVVARLHAEKDAGLFMCAAEAAGRLREGRALPDLLRGVRVKEWSTPVRSKVFEATIAVSGDRARDVLTDYLREPDADLLGTALHFLERIDKDAARREAAALLAGPRASSLSGEQLADLRRYAGVK